MSEQNNIQDFVDEEESVLHHVANRLRPLLPLDFPSAKIL